MKVIILAGGLGTRLAEETDVKPKPMVTIGDKPIIWHIMKTYASQIEAEFFIATGYKSEVIDSYLDSAAFKSENIMAKSIFTGHETSTGGRIKKILEQIDGDLFMATYGDGVCDININGLFDFHSKHGKIATITAVRPAARFGRLEISDGKVLNFSEKPQSQEGWINGGYFVFSRKIESYIDNYSEPLEHGPLSNLSKAGELMAYQHEGFWQPMDTLREKIELENLVIENKAPWMQNFI
jgi:glucose-1-phosphate cytidylyltransferase